MRFLAGTAALAVLLVVGLVPAAETIRSEDSGLRYTIPKAWTRIPAPSDMRAAQYRIPGDGEAITDGELVLFFFGAGKGGSVEQNLDRWYGQFEQPDGRPSKDAAVLTIRTIGAFRVTMVDLEGTYTPAAMGGSPAARRSGHRMLAAVVEGDGGPWFFRATGPAGTIDRAKTDFQTMLDSLEGHR